MKKGTKEEIKTEAAKEEVAPSAETMAPVEGKVGGMLRDARTKKGYSLDDVAKELYIRKSFLEAIESSNYEEIPEPPYGIGFIRSYADFLGLNSERIVQLFKEETDAKNQKEDVYVLEPQAEATMPNKKYLGISVLAIVVLYVAWLGYNKTQFEETPVSTGEDIIAEVSTPQTNDNFPLQVEEFATVDTSSSAEQPETLPIIDTTTAPVEETPQVTVSEENFVETPKTEETKENLSEEPKAQPQISETPKTEEVAEKLKEEVKPEKKVSPKAGSRVTIKVNKETWVEVKDGKKLWLSKVLQAGDSYQVPAGEGMILSVGRVDAVDVEIDGKVVPNVITSGKKTGIALDKYLSANH